MAKAKVVIKEETAQVEPDWYDLLAKAVEEPGKLAAAHKYFHQYSWCNRWLAATQLAAMGLPLMPVKSFKGWLDIGRNVIKGEHATISMVRPVPIKRKKEDADSEDKDEVLFTKFMLKRQWFHLGQTEGDEYQTPEAVESKDWRLESVLVEHEITETEFKFDSISDTRTSCSIGHTISVSPLAANPQLAKLKEIANILLGYNDEAPGKRVPTEQSVRDVESAATVFLVAATLQLADDLSELRGIIQANLEGASRVPAKVMNRAFSCADKIINAGYC